MNWEVSIDNCTQPWVRHIASGNPLFRAGSSARCSVMTQMGGMGSGWERAPRGRGHTYSYR